MISHLKIHNKGFTLIEFIVAITIFFIVSGASYIPYSHYQKKGLLNQGLKEITQSFYEARNLSINGLDSGSGNLSVGIYFDATGTENTALTYFTYPHSFTGTQITNIETSEIQIERKKTLPEGVQIDSISGEQQFLVFFEAITGRGSYYYWDTPGAGKTQHTTDEVLVDISYKGSTSPSLKRQIKYHTLGNIADY